MKKRNKKIIGLIIISLITFLLSSIIIYSATTYTLTVTVNNEDVAELHNVAVSGNIQSFTDEKRKGTEDVVIKYEITVTNSNALGKSIMTKATDENWEFVGWSSNPACTMGLDNSKSDYRIKPSISKDTTITAYYRPHGENVKTISYYTEAGGKLSGGYVPILEGKGVAPEDALDHAENYITIDAEKNVKTYSSNITLEPLDEGYVFEGWEDENGEIVSKSLEDPLSTIKPEDVKGNKSFTAKFKKIYVNIEYQVEGNGTVDKENEYTNADNIQGVTATANKDNYFIAWVKAEDNTIVSLDPTFKPTGDLVYDGAKYKAIFSGSADDKKVICLSNVDPEYGKLLCTATEPNIDYTNKVVSTSDTNSNHTYTGVVQEDGNDLYTYDFLAVNGKEYTNAKGAKAIHIKHAFDEKDDHDDGPYAPYAKPSIIKAYFAPKDSTGKIMYKVKIAENGTATESDALIGNLSNEVDYISKAFPTLSGCTAASSGTAEFVQWETEDGTVYSTDPTINPSEKETGQTFYAVYKEANKGKLLYNINLPDVPAEEITWLDEHDAVVEDAQNRFETKITKTSTGCSCLAEKYNYYGDKETFDVIKLRPQVEGYLFIGWFDKERKDVKEATILNPGDKDITFVGNNNYTIDALWIETKSEDIVRDYNGEEHDVENITSDLQESIYADESLQKYADQLKKLHITPEILFKDASGDYTQKESPKYKDAGEYIIDYKVVVPIGTVQYSQLRSVKMTINKIPIKIKPVNQTKEYGNFEITDWDVKYYDDKNAETSPKASDKLKFTLSIDATKNPKNKYDRYNVGEYPINVEFDDKAEENKNYIITTEPGTLTITPKTVTLKVNPEKAQRVYGNNDDPFTIVSEGIITGEEKEITYDYTLPDQYADAKTYTININADSNQGNYIVNTVSGELEITKLERPNENITVSGYNGIYDGDAHTISIDGIIDGKDVVTYSTDNGSTWVSELPKYTDITNGDIPVYVKVYNPNTNPDTIVKEEAKVTIEPKNIKVIVQNMYVEYYEELPKLESVVQGLIGDDKIEYSISTTAKKGDVIGEYDIIVTGDKNQGNYVIEYVNAKLTITQKGRTDIGIESYLGTYDAKSHTINVFDTIEGDNIQYSTDEKNWSSTKPTYTDVTDTALVYIKITNPNTKPETLYKFGTVTINPKKVTITANSSTVKYNEKIPNLTAVVEGVLGKDKVEYSLTTTATVGSSLGEYPINVIAKREQGNYIVSVVNGTLTIDPLQHTNLEVISYKGKYDGKEHTVTLKGIMPGDKVEYSFDGKQWVSDPITFKDVIDGKLVYVRVSNETTTPSVLNGSGTITILANKDDNSSDKQKGDNQTGDKQEGNSANNSSDGQGVNNSQNNNEKLPNGNNPSTGDNIIIYVSILIASICLFVITFKKSKKSKVKAKRYKK